MPSDPASAAAEKHNTIDHTSSTRIQLLHQGVGVLQSHLRRIAFTHHATTMAVVVVRTEFWSLLLGMCATHTSCGVSCCWPAAAAAASAAASSGGTSCCDSIQQQSAMSTHMDKDIKQKSLNARVNSRHGRRCRKQPTAMTSQ